MGTPDEVVSGSIMIFLLSCLTLFCQEMVYARISNAEALRSIKGMTEDANGNLMFNGERVVGITALGGGDSSEESPEAPEVSFAPNLSEPEPVENNLPGKDFSLSSRYDTDDIRDQVGDILNSVEEVTPIKSMKEVVSMQEVKSITPIKSIEEVKSIQEIKSIEEIKEHIARDFIKEHGLRNLIDDSDDEYGRPSTAAGMLQDLDELKTELKKDSKKCNILRKEIEKKLKEMTIMEELEDEHCTKAQYEIDEYKTLKEQIEEALGKRVDSIEPVENIEEVKSITPIDTIEEVKSITPIESIEEVKSITPIESIQEVKHMYELTDRQAQELKDLVLSQKWEGRKWQGRK